MQTTKYNLSFATFARTLAIAFLITFPFAVSAYTLGFDPAVGDTEQPLQKASQLGTADPTQIIFTIINTSLIFLGSITLIMVIVAGFMWLLAGGSEEKIKKAKDLLKGATIGLVIVLSSFGLANYVFTALQSAIISN
ncbi:MAG: hypothetical protein Q8P90_05280 [bacterium]|nr:hypothetical protein [bacterium]